MLDPGFGTDGLVSTTLGAYDDWGRALALQDDGKIILAGHSDNGEDFDFAMVRYTIDGNLDETFGSGGLVITPVGVSDDYCWAIALFNDGKILLAGTASNDENSDIALVRYNEDGSIDNSFGIDGFVMLDFNEDNDYGYTMTIQPDNKIIVAGTTTESYPYKEFAVARIHYNGTPDISFGVEGKVSTDMCMFTEEKATSILIQPDNKIIVGGNCFGFIGMVRYFENGTIDSTFGFNGIVNTNVGVDKSYPISFALQGDGKIIAAGHENELAPYSDKMNFGVVRYNTDGSVDNTFGDMGIVITDFDIAYGDVGLAVAIQTDGKIIVAGQSYTICFGNGFFALARYNIDGTLDTTFGTGGLVNTDFGFEHDAIFALAIQPDGKIVAGGQSGPDALSRRYFGLARYLNDCFYNTDRTVTQAANILTSSADDMIYQWVDCNNNFAPVLDGSNQTYTATQNGTYAVIINDGICADTSDCFVVNTLAADAETNLYQLTISPNPFDDNLNVSLQTENVSNQLWQIELFNSLGESVYITKIINGKVEINTESLLAGMYILKCHNQTDNKSFIVIKN